MPQSEDNDAKRNQIRTLPRIYHRCREVDGGHGKPKKDNAEAQRTQSFAEKPGKSGGEFTRKAEPWAPVRGGRC